jgi:hypothetical protein
MPIFCLTYVSNGKNKLAWTHKNPIVDDRIVILLPYTLLRVWGTEAAGAMVNGQK